MRLLDQRYRTLWKLCGLLTLAAMIYGVYAAVYPWGGFYSPWNWLVGIPFALVALYFVLLYTSELACLMCPGS